MLLQTGTRPLPSCTPRAAQHPQPHHRLQPAHACRPASCSSRAEHRARPAIHVAAAGALLPPSARAPPADTATRAAPAVLPSGHHASRCAALQPGTLQRRCVSSGRASSGTRARAAEAGSSHCCGGAAAGSARRADPHRRRHRSCRHLPSSSDSQARRAAVRCSRSDRYRPGAKRDGRSRRTTTTSSSTTRPDSHRDGAQSVPSTTGRAAAELVVLGNTCVDVVLPVDSLPPPEPAARQQLLRDLLGSQQPRSSWEVGGSCNAQLAAARLGLRTAAVGHLGGDEYGAFMLRVLQEEGLQVESAFPPPMASGLGPSRLICFVLVDAAGRHAFCSPYDFGPFPMLPTQQALAPEAVQVLCAAKVVYTNGFLLDEFPVGPALDAVQAAVAHGAQLFFDPGPRCLVLAQGPRRSALERLLDLSHVLLMTEEEALHVTGSSDPVSAAAWVMQRPDNQAEWVVVKQGGRGSTLVMRSQPLHPLFMPAVQVQVQDTVGCGDSFAGAVALGCIRGAEPAATMALASCVGAATAMGRGAGRNVASLAQVKALLLQASQGRCSLDARVAGQALELLQQHDPLQQLAAR